MTDDAKGLRHRLQGGSEETLGKLAQDLLENPLVSGAISRAFEAREKAVQAQEVAFNALNIPSAAEDRKSTRLNSSHANISYAVFCLKKKPIALISSRRCRIAS